MSTATPAFDPVPISDDAAWDLVSPKAPPYPGYSMRLSSGMTLFCRPDDRRYYLRDFPDEATRRFWQNEARLEAESAAREIGGGT